MRGWCHGKTRQVLTGGPGTRGPDGCGARAGARVAVGYCNYSQCIPPEPNAGFTSIAAGVQWSGVLTAANEVLVWGRFDYEVPPPTAAIRALAGGGAHLLGLTYDGAILAWGYNEAGQCDVPLPNDGYSYAAAGFLHSPAIRSSPAGACCRVDGTCILAMESTCAPPNTWLGADTACIPGACSPGGACCSRRQHRHVGVGAGGHLRSGLGVRLVGPARPGGLAGCDGRAGDRRPMGRPG